MAGSYCDTIGGTCSQLSDAIRSATDDRDHLLIVVGERDKALNEIENLKKRVAELEAQRAAIILVARRSIARAKGKLPRWQRIERGEAECPECKERKCIERGPAETSGGRDYRCEICGTKWREPCL